MADRAGDGDRDRIEDEVEGTLPQDGPVETPAQAIERLSGELEGVQRRTSGRSVEFVRGSTVFAVQAGSRCEFRLRAEIVFAALRTPETSKSERGADWVALDTSAGDTFTVDRTVAWFETAWRFAAPPALPH